MIEVKNLKKSYGSREALHGISFTVERGHVYGFLGPNGAGKSTTMNIITGCLAPSDGSVTINGHDIIREPIEAKRCIGYLPEQPPLYMDMKVTEYLAFVGRAKGLRGAELYSQVDEVIDLTCLSEVYDRLIKNLSKGYRQRVGIAQAMLGDPEIVILDEPTVGLDPIQIIEIRDLIRSLAEKRTVILSSHIMQEISAVCDRIIMIAGGRIVANDTIEGLLETYSTTVTLEIDARCGKDRLEGALRGLDCVQEASFAPVSPTDSVATLVYSKKNDIRETVWKKLTAAGITVLGMIPHIMTLEDIFISLTGDNAHMAAVPDGTAAPERKDALSEKAPEYTRTNADDTADGNDGYDDDNDDDDKDDDGDDYTPLFS